MSRTAEAFHHGKAFIAFLTGGDPDIETTERLIPAMEEAGADLIEIGIPFSDPIAEGIVIQEANERALAAGCTIEKLFAMTARLRNTVKIPLAFMTYMNPIFAYGKIHFLEKCRECGIDAVIIPDLPFEEKGEIAAECEAYGIDLISMIAPTSHERIKKIAKEAKGFVYCVSSLGVTGVRQEIKTDIKGMVDLVKTCTDVPAAVGFGIQSPEQAKKMADLSDGVIVGSAIVKLIAAHQDKSVNVVSEYIKTMKLHLQ